MSRLLDPVFGCAAQYGGIEPRGVKGDEFGFRTMSDRELSAVKAAGSAAELIAGARRITVKIGSSLFIDKAGKGVRGDWLASVAEDIVGLRERGKQIILVSSGSVALGYNHLGLKRSHRLAHKQAAAAAGQSLLMRAWEKALAPHGVPTAQLLL